MSELDRLARKLEKALLKLAETERQLEAVNAKYEPLVTENDELREKLAEAEARLQDALIPHEQAVLDAMASADRWALQLHVCKDTEGTWCHAAAVAELARRDAKDDQPSNEERCAGAREHDHLPAESTGARGAQTPAPRSCEDEGFEGETLP